MKQANLFDVDEARAARDEGIATVLLHNEQWLDRALRLLREMKTRHAEATGEFMKRWLLSRGLEEPTSAHAWGALVRTAARRGMIVDTGRTASMKLKRSHARRTPVWRFS